MNKRVEGGSYAEVGVEDAQGGKSRRPGGGVRSACFEEINRFHEHLMLFP